MSSTVSPLPEEDFTDPLARLQDSHRRIERFLELTRDLALRTNQPPTAADREHLRLALRYLRKGPRSHSEDEEASLFPRLRQARASNQADALMTIDDLEKEHNAAAHSHRLVEELFERWMQSGPLNRDQYTRIVNTTSSLREAYRVHIEFEDTVLFPLATQLLTQEQLHAIGEEMLTRRVRASASMSDTSKCAARRRQHFNAQVHELNPNYEKSGGPRP